MSRSTPGQQIAESLHPDRVSGIGLKELGA